MLVTANDGSVWYRLAVGMLGLQLLWAVEYVFMTPLLLSYGVGSFFVSYAWLPSPILQLILSPVLGRWSDNCTSVLGKRRPFITLFAIVAAIAMAVIPFAGHIGRLLGDPAGSDKVHYVAACLVILGFVLADMCNSFNEEFQRILITDLAADTHARIRGHSILSASVGLGAGIGYFTGAVPFSGSEARTVFLLIFLCIVLFLPATLLTLVSAKEQPGPSDGGWLALCLPRGLIARLTTRRRKNSSDSEDSGFSDPMSPHLCPSDEESSSSSESTGSHRPANVSLLSPTPQSPLLPSMMAAPDMSPVVGSPRPNSRPSSPAAESGFTVKLAPAPPQVRPLEMSPSPVPRGPPGDNDACRRDPNDLAPNGGAGAPSLSSTGVPAAPHDHSLWSSLKHAGRPFLVLCALQILAWLGLWPVFQFITAYFGGTVYNGDPSADSNSAEGKRYEAGIRMGSIALGIMAMVNVLCSTALPPLMERVPAKSLFVFTQVVSGSALVGLLHTTNTTLCVVLLSLVGFSWAANNSIPFVLVRGIISDPGQLGMYTNVLYLAQTFPQLIAAAGIGPIVDYFGGNFLAAMIVSGFASLASAVMSVMFLPSVKTVGGNAPMQLLP